MNRTTHTFLADQLLAVEFANDALSIESPTDYNPKYALLCKELTDSRKASLWLLLLLCAAPFPDSSPSSPPRTTPDYQHLWNQDTDKKNKVPSPCGSHCCFVLLLVSYLFCLDSCFHLQVLMVPDSRATVSPEVSKTWDSWKNIWVPAELDANAKIHKEASFLPSLPLLWL